MADQQTPRLLRELCCASSAEALAHLLLVLDHAADCIEEDHGETADAYLLRAHAAQLRAGREWPGDEVRCAFDFPPPALAARPSTTEETT